MRQIAIYSNVME